jgi:hypothetical protein
MLVHLQSLYGRFTCPVGEASFLSKKRPGRVWENEVDVRSWELENAGTRRDGQAELAGAAAAAAAA